MNLKQISLLFLLLIISTTGFSQERESGKKQREISKEEKVEREKKDKFKIPKILKSIVPYGTLELAFAGNDIGWGVVDGISRAGVRGSWDISENGDYTMFMTAEIGVSIVSKNDYIDIIADPGGPFGKTNDLFFARQGYIGVGTPYGNISIGKQWGVHYAIAGYIDNMYFMGGDAIGVYNAGTDGGVSGTGRADNAVKYELIRDNFYLGLQAQFRSISANDKYFADTYGMASYYKFNRFKIGASYNKVLDGIEAPTQGEAAEGDENFSVLLDYAFKHFHFGILGSSFNKHEITDDGTYFNGKALEYNLKYNFGKKREWSLVQNTSFMTPNNNENLEYQRNLYSVEVARRFNKNALIASGFRHNDITNNDGSDNSFQTLYIGFYYNFNYPVP